MSSTRDLEGEVALVVGGSRNQGAAFAENIASRGATTVISYANGVEAAEQTVALPRKPGVAAEAIQSDARVSGQVNELFEGVVRRYGKLDITPGAVIKKPLADFTDADFDHLIDLNTRSAFNTLRATARNIADNGRYVVLSTTLTSIMTGPYGLYSGSKAAVERMVLAAAKELGARGITVDDSFYRAGCTYSGTSGPRQACPPGITSSPES